MSNHDCWTLTGAHLRDLVLNLLKLALWGGRWSHLILWCESGILGRVYAFPRFSQHGSPPASKSNLRPKEGCPRCGSILGVDSAACDASLGGQCAHPCRLRPTPRARDKKIAKIRFGCVSFRRVEDFRILQSLRCSTGNPSGTSRMRGFMF